MQQQQQQSLKNNDNSNSNNYQTPYSRFMHSIHSPETQKRYPDRFKAFLDFIQTPGTNIEERLLNFYNQAKQDPQGFQNALMEFILFQKDRVQKGEISASTISNYYKPVKLFCEVNDILINWKFIARKN